MSRLGAKIQRERAIESRAARRLIRELLPEAFPAPQAPSPPPPEPAPLPPWLEAPRPLWAPWEPAIAVLLVILLVALFGAVSALGRC